MSWVVRWRDQTYSSLDLTLDEVEAIEKVSDLPWSLANPLARVAAARAFLAVFLMRDGLNDDQIRDQLNTLRLRDISGAFEYVPDEPDLPAPAAETGRVDPPEVTSPPPLSAGPPNGSDGHPPSPALKPSGISTPS